LKRRQGDEGKKKNLKRRQEMKEKQEDQEKRAQVQNMKVTKLTT
jgi:hypothetical protein